MLSENMTVDIDLEEIINEVLVAAAKADDRDYKHFHPSEWYQCHRKIAYKFYEAQGYIEIDSAEMEISPQLQRIFGNGHSMHDRLGKNLQSTGMLRGRWKCANPVAHDKPKVFGEDEHLGIFKPDKCECGSTKFIYREVGFYDPETMLGGHVDAILDLRGRTINGTYIPEDATVRDSHLIIDFKSINSWGFKALAEPKPEHRTQMQIYLYLSGLAMGKFLYENKDNQSFREFVVPEDKELIKQKTDEARFLKKVVTTLNSKGERTLPVRPHKKDNNKECVECKFRAHCWGL